MNMELETRIKAALPDIERLRTAKCLDVDTIGRYADNTLLGAERDTAEQHLHTCLYCLKQLNDMTAMLHYQEQASDEMLADKEKTRHKVTLWERLSGFFTFTPSLWRYSTVGLATAWAVFLIWTILPHQAAKPVVSRLNDEALVTITGYNSAGKITGTQRGAIVSSDGYIEGDLQPLAGASTMQVTLRNGKKHTVTQFWKDDDTGYAVMKIDDDNLPRIKLADIDSIQVGQRIYAVPGDADGTEDVVIVSDFKAVPGRRSTEGNRLIQIATQNSVKRTSKLVDEKGNLVGYVIDEEKNIQLARPAGAYRSIIKASQPLPVSELSSTTFSAKALDEYLKGVMANDNRRWSEAIRHLQAAVALNPRFAEAYTQLGYAYYQINDIEKEAKAYQAALKIKPNDPDALYSLAMNMESQEKYEEAIPLYEKALAQAPDDKETLYQLGLSYLANNKKEKATEMYYRLKKFDHGQAELLRRLIK